MKKVLFTGGGSAGHVVPNLALIEALQGEADVCYIGTDGVEKALVTAQKIPYFEISCPKFVRGFAPSNLKIPAAFLRAEKRAAEGLAAFRPDVVFSKGGYVALPVVFAAKKLKIPASRTKAICPPGSPPTDGEKMPLCPDLFSRDGRERFKNGKYCGSPLREELFRGSREAAIAKYGFSGKKKVLLVFGGGSGSRALNDALRACAVNLSRNTTSCTSAAGEISCRATSPAMYSGNTKRIWRTPMPPPISSCAAREAIRCSNCSP